MRGGEDFLIAVKIVISAELRFIFETISFIKKERERERCQLFKTSIKNICKIMTCNKI